jgi:hypothetical protein
VRNQVTIHIERDIDSHATPGAVWLDSRLLDSGRFSWGVVQHEFAHQIDFFLLTQENRVELQRLLGAATGHSSARRSMPAFAASC